MEIDYRFKIAQVPLWRLLELEAIMKERSGETMLDYIRSKENTKGFSRFAEVERRVYMRNINAQILNPNSKYFVYQDTQHTKDFRMSVRVVSAHKFTAEELQSIDEVVEYMFIKLQEYIEGVGRQDQGVIPLQLDNSIYDGVSLEKYNNNVWVTIVEDILEMDAFNTLLMMRLSAKGKKAFRVYKDKGWHKSFREPFLTQEMAQTLRAKFSR